MQQQQGVAPIPKGYIFTYEQFITFDSPEVYNAKFFRCAMIPSNYGERTNELLRRIDHVCRFKSITTTTTTTEEEEEQEEWTTESIREANDIVYLELDSTNNEIIVKIVGIRPCFAGHHFFMILVYKLFRLACITNKILVFATCYPLTYNALMRHFSDVVDRNLSFDTTLVFSNHHALLAYITSEYLNIAHLVFENSKGVIQIKTLQFPSARQLNDQDYVDEYYQNAIILRK